MKRSFSKGAALSALGRLALPALLLAGLSGCASAKIPEFQAFADAGTAYTQAVSGLLTQVGNTAVNANSVQLLDSREIAAVALADFQQQDQDMRNYLAELNRIDAQTTLLGDYFQALADLANSNAPESFSTEVESVATSLEGVTEAVRGTTIAQAQPLAAAAGSVSGLVVQEIQGKELQRELNARKETIAEILRLQQKLLAALSSQTEANTRFVNTVTYDQQVVAPFEAAPITAAPAQQSWMAQRLTFLSQPPLVQQVDTVAKAALDLQQAWTKLLTNDLTAEEVQAITANLTPVLTSLEALKKASTTTASTGGSTP
jgi:hypothetical protein